MIDFHYFILSQLRVLNDREFQVINLRAKGKTLEECGKELGVTRERIRQVEAKAISKWKKAIIIKMEEQGVNKEAYKNFLSNLQSQS